MAQRQFRKFLQMRNWGWFVILQKTRGMIGQPKPEEELRFLEEKANATWGEYKKALDVPKELESEDDKIKLEIKEMNVELAKSQGDMSQYTDRQAKALTKKIELDSALAEAQKQLAAEEASRVQLAHSGSVNLVKKEIQDIELAIRKVEQEKANKDRTISALNDEIQF